MVNARRHYEREMLDHEMYSKEELDQMVLDAREGDKKQRDRLILSHMRLVYKKAYNMRNKSKLSKHDLVGYGVIGLMRAIDKFQSGQGAKFTTYANSWISSIMTRNMINLGRNIRVPVYKQEQAKYGDGDQQKQAEVDVKMAKTTSLDMKRGKEENSNLYRIEGVKDVYFKDLIEEDIRKMLKFVTDKEKEAIVRYYGLFGMRESNLREVGESEGVSHEAIRIRLKRGLNRIKEAVKNGNIKVDQEII